MTPSASVSIPARLTSLSSGDGRSCQAPRRLMRRWRGRRADRQGKASSACSRLARPVSPSGNSQANTGRHCRCVQCCDRRSGVVPCPQETARTTAAIGHRRESHGRRNWHTPTLAAMSSGGAWTSTRDTPGALLARACDWLRRSVQTRLRDFGIRNWWSFRCGGSDHTGTLPRRSHRGISRRGDILSCSSLAVVRVIQSRSVGRIVGRSSLRELWA